MSDETQSAASEILKMLDETDQSGLAGVRQALAGALDAMQKRAEEAEASAQAANELLEEERVRHQEREAELSRQLLDMAAAKGKVEREKAKVERAAQPPKPRTIRRSGEKAAFDGIELAGLLNGGEPFEIVFCEKGKETLAVRPIRVTGDAWAVTAGSATLREAVEIESDAGPGCEVAIDGLALFDPEGGQVAYRALPDIIRIMAGRRHRLERVISF